MERRLTGPEIHLAIKALGDAFDPQEFADLLLFRLDRRVSDYSAPQAYPLVLRDVLLSANRKLWWRDLLIQARNVLPADSALVELAQDLGLAAKAHATASLEQQILESGAAIDVVAFRTRFGEIESRVCRVECPTSKGTGFLVGPNVVLTNFHVIEAIAQGQFKPGQVVLRFDHKVQADGVTVGAGKTYALAADWLLEHSRYSDKDLTSPPEEPSENELDYAFLKVEGAPGEDPVGGDTSDLRLTARGWIKDPGLPHDFQKSPAIYIVQHPKALPMKVAINTQAIVEVTPNGRRVRYRTTTESGSSGAPCFNANWEWVALHHIGDPGFTEEKKLKLKPEFNSGIPIPALRKLLEKRGKLGLLGTKA